MRFALAILSLSLGFSTVLVAATPPPDMIDAIEAAKANNRKRTPQEAVQKRGEGSLEKKWVVLPSSAIPGHLRPPPHNSIFMHRPSVAGDAEATAAPVHNRIKKIVQKRAPPQAANETVSAAPAAETPAPSPAPAPSGNDTAAVASISINPLNPFDWPQAVTKEYNTTLDHFNSMDSLSKVGLAAIITVSVLILLGLLICGCKISRSRKRRRAEKIRIKAEAEKRMDRMAAYRTESRSTTGSSSKSVSSGSPSSINSDKKSGGVFGWMKKKSGAGDSGEVLPANDRLREMQQNSMSWDPKRAKSWDARARGTGGSPNVGRGGGFDAPQAPGGSMKGRTRSWGGQ